jgi:hypothetical protein
MISITFSYQEVERKHSLAVVDAQHVFCEESDMYHLLWQHNDIEVYQFDTLLGKVWKKYATYIYPSELNKFYVSTV